MFKTLYTRLAAALMGILLLAAVLLIAFDLISNRRLLQEINQDVHRDLAGQLLDESIPIQDGRIDPDALEHIFHMLMVINPAIEVYLLDPGGAVLAYSAKPGSVVRMRVDTEPIRRFLEPGARLPLFGDDPKSAAKRKVFSAAPIPADRGGGYLYVILGGQQYESTASMLQTSRSLRLGAAALVGILAAAAAAGLLLFASITRPVRTLVGSVKRFQSSNFAGVFEASGAPATAELEDLERAFADMAERLAEHMSELRKTDELRRDLIANVSHDLRTPITSLRGYLETLSLKAHLLSETERKEYLDVALRHSERLGKLVADLFELARLDSLATELACEPVALAELLADILQGFELEAERQKVTLQAAIDASDSAFAETDAGLIERILGNLLDNAIRHTPQGGHVTLGLAPAPDGYRITVQDTGPGIAPEDLPHLFDRFFRRATGPSASRDGAGLGLAIAQQALNVLGSELEVSSGTPDSPGATFAFVLGSKPS